MTDHPLVSTQWLDDHLSSPDLIVINAWMPPVTHPDAPPVYPNAHIPGAVFFDVNEICDKSSDLPHMLPAPHVFSSTMRKMGIGDGQTLVVYDDFGFYSAPRVWWTLRSMGAERVYVLDGGFPKWRAEGRAFNDDTPRRVQSHFSSRQQSQTDLDRSWMPGPQNGLPEKLPSPVRALNPDICQQRSTCPSPSLSRKMEPSCRKKNWQKHFRKLVWILKSPLQRLAVRVSPQRS